MPSVAKQTNAFGYRSWACLLRLARPNGKLFFFSNFPFIPLVEIVIAQRILGVKLFFWRPFRSDIDDRGR